MVNEGGSPIYIYMAGWKTRSPLLSIREESFPKILYILCIHVISMPPTFFQIRDYPWNPW